jgi:hypothetical protein
MATMVIGGQEFAKPKKRRLGGVNNVTKRFSRDYQGCRQSKRPKSLGEIESQIRSILKVEGISQPDVMCMKTLLSKIRAKKMVFSH